MNLSSDNQREYKLNMSFSVVLRMSSAKKINVNTRHTRMNLSSNNQRECNLNMPLSMVLRMSNAIKSVHYV